MISSLLDSVKKIVPQVWAQTPPPGIKSPPPKPGGWATNPPVSDPPYAELSDLEFVFHRLISALFFAGGLVAFAYLIIGGFKYLTSSGDEDAMEMAKKTITYAVIGLLIVILSWLILATLGAALGLSPDPNKPGGFILFDIPQ